MTVGTWPEPKCQLWATTLNACLQHLGNSSVHTSDLVNAFVDHQVLSLPGGPLLFLQPRCPWPTPLW